MRMDLKQIGIDTTNWIESGQGLLESPCECGIEHPGSVRCGVIIVIIIIIDIIFIDIIIIIIIIIIVVYNIRTYFSPSFCIKFIRTDLGFDSQFPNMTLLNERHWKGLYLHS